MGQRLPQVVAASCMVVPATMPQRRPGAAKVQTYHRESAGEVVGGTRADVAAVLVTREPVNEDDDGLACVGRGHIQEGYQFIPVGEWEPKPGLRDAQVH